MASKRTRYPRQYRLSRGPDLQRVLREGKRVRSEHCEVRMLASLLLHPRFGVIVPKHRHSSVERNRLKRQLREIIRQDVMPAFSLPADLIIRAAPGAYGASYSTLRAEIIGDINRVVNQNAGH